MKRPLLWVVIVFALGEVICRLSITTAVVIVSLACTAFIVVQICGRNTKYFVFRLLFFCFLAGVFLGYGSDRTEDGDFCLKENPAGEAYKLTGKVISVTEQENGSRILLRRNGTKFLVYADTGQKAEKPENIRHVYPGQKLEVTGTLKLFEGNANPGQFDAKAYYESQGIRYQITADDIVVVDARCNVIKTALMKLRCALSLSLDTLLPKREASVIKAMLLGEKSDMDAEVKKLYQVNGIAHILAISGLHVALIGGCIICVLKQIGMGKRKAAVLSMGLMLLYGMMTGFAAATMRAVIMILISQIGDLKKRSPDIPTSMAAALLLMLLTEPAGIENASFQMSFMAVLGVDAGNRIYRKTAEEAWLKRLKSGYGKWAGKILHSFLVSLSVNLFMMPLQIYHYYEIPTYSMLLNFLVMPMLSGAVASGFASAVFGLLLPWVSGGMHTVLFILGKGLAMPCIWILKFYEWLCRVFLKLPFHRLNTGHCRIPALLVYYGLMFLVIRLILHRKEGKSNNRGRKINSRNGARRQKSVIVIFSLSGILLLLVFLAGIYSRNQIKFRAVFLSVGQGDSCIIHTPEGLNLMVDGGASDHASVGAYILLPALKYYGMSELDYVFISHTDTDHINGILYLLEHEELLGIKIRCLVFADGIYEDDNFHLLEQAAKREKTEIIYVSEGRILKNSRTEIEILYPEPVEGDDKSEHGGGSSEDGRERSGNDYSLVMNFRYQNLDILFTGDISCDTEEKLLEDIYRISQSQDTYIMLKTAHHGSKYSSGAEFLNALAGDAAVISCGKYNLYGHPSEETLYRLTDAGYKIFRTDEDGAVIVEF